MIKIIEDILDQIWNLKALTGYRSLVAEYGGLLCGFIVAYSGYTLSGESALPAIPASALVAVGAVQAFLAKKQKQFVKEHVDTDKEGKAKT